MSKCVGFSSGSINQIVLESPGLNEICKNSTGGSKNNVPTKYLVKITCKYVVKLSVVPVGIYLYDFGPLLKSKVFNLFFDQ